MDTIVKPELVCPWCKKLFVPRVKNQKFCSFDCTRKLSQKNYYQRKRRAKRLARIKSDLFA